MTSLEWSTPITGQVTAARALELLDGAIAYADDAIANVMDRFKGTPPPPRQLMPELYKRKDNATKARDAVKVIADRTPSAELLPAYVLSGKTLGVALIDEANRVMDAAAKGQDPAAVAKQLASAASGAAGKVLKLGNIAIDLGGPLVFWGAVGYLGWRAGWFGARGGRRRRRLA